MKNADKSNNMDENSEITNIISQGMSFYVYIRLLKALILIEFIFVYVNLANEIGYRMFVTCLEILWMF